MRFLPKLLALIAGLGSSANAAVDAQIQTRAAVEIREAATISILADAPFQLLITSGGMPSYLYSPKSRALRMASGSEPQSALLFSLNTVERTRAYTPNSELLSVSVELLDGNALSSGGPGIPLILAQFN